MALLYQEYFYPGLGLVTIALVLCLGMDSMILDIPQRSLCTRRHFLIFSIRTSCRSLAGYDTIEIRRLKGTRDYLMHFYFQSYLNAYDVVLGQSNSRGTYPLKRFSTHKEALEFVHRYAPLLQWQIKDHITLARQSSLQKRRMGIRGYGR